MSRLRQTGARAALLALAVTALGTLALAAPAAAHVTVNPAEATQDGYARVAFRVPNESDTADTVKLEVTLPADAPVASVSTMPVPGWAVAVERRKLDTPIDVHGSPVTEVTSKITWTAAAGAGVKPGQFQEFPVSMGPLPKVDKMVFKVLQHYSDNNIARWIEEPVEGGEEPDNPAPVLKLSAAAAAPTGTASPVVTVTAEDGDDDDSDGAAGTWLGAAGLIAGVAGLVLGALAFARTRKST